MIYTATILFCMIGQPNTFETCEIVEGKVKFRTESSCALAIIEKIDTIRATTSLLDRYEIMDIRCFKWGIPST